MLERAGESDDALLPGGVPMPPSHLERGCPRFSAQEARPAYTVSTIAVQKAVALRDTPVIVTPLEGLRQGVPFQSAFFQRILKLYEDIQTMVGRQ